MKTKFRGILTLFLALVVQISFAQQKQVSGTVTDDEGIHLPGVNITIEGQENVGTQTDFDGHYTLQVEQGVTLNFSYIGFADKTVKVGMQNTIDVTLKAGQELDVVKISTGYQTTTKRRSTKAITTVTAADIEDRPNASAIQTLQGQVAGLSIGTTSGQPGNSSTVILRGIGSLNGRTAPLYVIDGVPATQNG